MGAGDQVREPKLLLDVGFAGMRVKLFRGDSYGLHIVGGCI